MIKYLWQLPQNLLGLAVIFFSKARKRRDIWYTDHNFGVSLGNYIIVFYGADQTVIKHEQGHQKQSLYLGPLYLLVIGLPSAVGNLLNRIIPFDYYKQPWEAWADKLGGVKR